MPAVARRRAAAAPERKAASRRPAAAAVPSGITKLNPMGTGRLRVRRVHRHRTRGRWRGCSSRWASRAVARHRSKNVTLLPPGRDQLHRERRARQLRAGLRASARPDRSAPSRSASTTRRRRWQARSRAGRQGADPGEVGPDGAGTARRSRAIGGSRDLSRRPLWRAGSIYDIDFKPIAGADQHPEGVGLVEIDHLTHNVYRGRMDQWAQFYETALQLPRNPLLRHRGQADGPEVAGDDQPVRQDPHPDQRILGRQVADRRVPRRVSAARASSTSRSSTADIYETVEALRASRRRVPATPPDTYYELVDRAPARPRRGRRAAEEEPAS